VLQTNALRALLVTHHVMRNWPAISNYAMKPISLLALVLCGHIACTPAARVYVDVPRGLQIRESPSSSATALGLARTWTEVTVLDGAGPEATVDGVKGRWIKITSGTISGWIFDAHTVPVRDTFTGTADFQRLSSLIGKTHLGYPEFVNLLGRISIRLPGFYEITFLENAHTKERAAFVERRIAWLSNNRGQIMEFIDYLPIQPETTTAHSVVPYWGQCAPVAGFPVIAIVGKDVDEQNCRYKRVLSAWSLKPGDMHFIPISPGSVSCGPPCCGLACN